MPVRGIRGATVIETDQPEAILAATRELLAEIISAAGAMFVVVADPVALALIRAPEADAEQFEKVWRGHVHALNGQYRLAD